MLAVVGLVCFWLFPDAFRPEGRSFAPYRAQLEVARTALDFDQTEHASWLTGYVANTGNHPWRVRELEVRLLQGETGLVDVPHSRIREPFVVQPHQERAFRVGLGRLAFTNSAIAAKVRVQTATDGNLPVEPD
jgi:hypothetical protein